MPSWCENFGFDRTFSSNWPTSPIYESENPRDHRLQGTLWEIRQEDVVKVEHLQYAVASWEAYLRQEAYWDSKQVS